MQGKMESVRDDVENGFKKKNDGGGKKEMEAEEGAEVLCAAHETEMS